jgi:hypothetical protein
MALLNLLKEKGTTLTPLRANKPTSSLVGAQLKVNNTFVKGQYQLYTLDTDELLRARDLTPFSTNRP